MQATEASKEGKTAVRHGKLDLFLEWLRRQDFTPELTEATREDLSSLKAEDRFYGELSKGDRILFIQSPGVHGEMPKHFYHIVI